MITTLVSISHSHIRSNQKSGQNVSLNYKLAKNLDLNISGGIDYSNVAVSYFNLPVQLASPITAGQSSTNNNKTQYAFRLNYDNTFNEKHSINATAIKFFVFL